MLSVCCVLLLCVVVRCVSLLCVVVDCRCRCCVLVRGCGCSVWFAVVRCIFGVSNCSLLFVVDCCVLFAVRCLLLVVSHCSLSLCFVVVRSLSLFTVVVRSSSLFRVVRCLLLVNGSSLLVVVAVSSLVSVCVV